MRYSHFAAVRR